MSDIKKCDRCRKTYEYDFSDKPTDTETRYLTTITLNAKRFVEP